MILIEQAVSIGEYLRKTRENIGFSRARLSEITGINQNSIAKYEKAGIEGGQYPPLEKLVTLAFALGLDPRIIFAYAAQNEEERDHFLNLGERLPEIDQGFKRFHTDLEHLRSEFVSVLEQNSKIEKELALVQENEKRMQENEKRLLLLEKALKEAGKLSPKNGPDQ